MKTLVLFIILSGSVLAQTPSFYTITFDSAASTSDSVYMYPGESFAGILVPATFADTLKFQVSINGGTGNWYNLVDNDGILYVVKCLTSSANAVPLKPILFYPFRLFRVVVTTSDTPAGGGTLIGVSVPYLK